MLLLKTTATEPEAAKWLGRTLELDPGNGLALSELVQLHEANHNSEAARETIESVLRLCPGCPDANLAKADFLIRSGDLQGAIPALTSASKSPAVHEAALRMLTETYRKMGDIAKAIEAQTQIVTILRAELQRAEENGLETKIPILALRRDEAELALIRNSQKEGTH